MSLFIVSKLSVVRLLSSVVPFFASRSAVSFPCIPTCDGIHWKTIVLSCLLRYVIVNTLQKGDSKDDDDDDDNNNNNNKF